MKSSHLMLGVAALVLFFSPLSAEGESSKPRPSFKNGEIADAKQRVWMLEDQIHVEPRFSTEGLNNSWTAADEAGFRKRADSDIRRFKGQSRVNTTGEREKYDYPLTVGAWLSGDHKEAIEVLQRRDVDGQDHAWTKGIDLYWGFTLKAQMLKFFYLEDQLDPEYRETMLKAFKIWTEKDPRPTLEYALNTFSADAEVAAFATSQLKKMWRDAKAVKAMAEKAIGEGHPNKKRFGEYLLSILDRWPEKTPTQPDEWHDWWGLVAAGGWMIFEEYERRTNPHPHPEYGVGTGPVGETWNPAVRGMRADARNTDNLRGMREGTIYLASEIAGNELLRKLYKDRIRRTALGFWEVGNGEWDSSSYHPHTICAYYNLYSFAKDREVRLMAKAILDFLYTAGAVKYWRGSWGGPNRRDYGNLSPMTSAAEIMWLMYGDSPVVPRHEMPDNTWPIVAGYRPPAALAAFARKEFPKPLEMFNTHPNYSNWLPGQSERPESFETMFYGNSYTAGTLAKGSRGDTCGFRILSYSEERGADFIVGASGSTKRIVTGTGQDRIGQYRNLILLLSPGQVHHRKKGQVPNQVHLLFPKQAKVEKVSGVHFIQNEKTWLALLPVGLEALTESQSKIGKKGKAQARFLSGVSTGSSLCGYGIEIGEKETHGDYESFKKKVLSTSKLTIKAQKAELLASDGRRLSVQYAKSMPIVQRDGKTHDWDLHQLYHTVENDALRLKLKERKLTVKAGGHEFSAELKENGEYVWLENVAGP